MLTALATSSAELRKHTQGLKNEGKPDMGAVVRALKSFDHCRDGLDTLKSQGKDWLGFQLGDQPPADRVERARSAVERLGRMLDEVRQSALDADEKDWAGLALDSDVMDSHAVFAHADRYTCKDHLGAAAVRVVASLRSKVTPGPALDLAMLRKFSGLEEWADRKSVV